MKIDAIDGQSPSFSRIALWIAGLMFASRVVFAALVDLLPEEAYYWNYSRHLDIGYLDHPPLSAWLIWLSTSVFGHSEFAVRLPALLMWIVFAVFMFRLSHEILGRKAAFGCLILVSVLPIYWSVGIIMTPDAVLYALWAVTLFYARRAIVASDRRAWVGVGVGIGLGLLAKYTMALLGASILAFLLFDHRARRSLLTPKPYLATLMAVAIFSPVLIWNYQHDWASFAFQGSRRWATPSTTFIHILIGSALILLTPLGLWDAIKTLVHHIKARTATVGWTTDTGRDILFALIACGLPLSVFVIHSLVNQTKLNWTGPVWLAILPWVADAMVVQPANVGVWLSGHLRKVWRVTIAALVMFYPLGLIWILIGAPGQPAKLWYKLPIAWDEFGEAVEQVETRVADETGQRPLIAGMDNYWIASEGSFYDESPSDQRTEFTGRNVIGRTAVMWGRWFDPDSLDKRTVILMGFLTSDVTQPAVARSFADLGPVREQTLSKRGRAIGKFYWRLAANPIPGAISP